MAGGGRPPLRRFGRIRLTPQPIPDFSKNRLRGQRFRSAFSKNPARGAWVRAAGILTGRFGSRKQESESDRGAQAPRDGHRVSRGPGRPLHGADPAAHRASQGEPEGSSLPPWPSSPGREAASPAQLPEPQRRRALPRPDLEARNQEVINKAGGRSPGQALEGRRSSGAYAQAPDQPSSTWLPTDLRADGGTTWR